MEEATSGDRRSNEIKHEMTSQTDEEGNELGSEEYESLADEFGNGGVDSSDGFVE